MTARPAVVAGVSRTPGHLRPRLRSSEVDQPSQRPQPRRERASRQ
jgi:hypothetical protein